ncbi:MAG: hypothetical protein A2Y33_09295 [Spirochaetes bacterium GWF1_51_8]|nr:MAG: hypothetical protein A2Y33_09295 [Spirochaetes bacterium GWF1_51_8]
MKRIAALLKTDIKSISRDSILIAITLAPILIALVFKFGIPPLRELAAPYFELRDYYPLITAFFPVIVPSMYGFVIGFMLLDDRDENTLTALAVTPLGKMGYVWYKLSIPTLTSLVMVLALTPFIGLMQFDFIRFIPVALMTSLEAPIVTLFLSSFASNKVEGLALAKLDGVFFLPMCVPFFTKSPLQYIGGIMPSFWAGKSFESLSAGWEVFLPVLLLGFASHFLFLILGYLKFRTRLN